MSDAEGSAVVLGNGFIGSAVAATMIERFQSVRMIARTPRERDTELLDAGVHIDYANEAKTFWELAADRAATSETLFSALGTASPSVVESDFTNELHSALRNAECIATIMNTNPHLTSIHVSSGGCVYGESPRTGSRESDHTNPIGKYGHLHVEVENLLAQEIHEAAERSIIVRVANPYGAAQVFAQGLGFVAYASQQIIGRKPVNLLSDGGQIRDYVHIDDVALSIALLASSRHARGTFNIGTGIGTSSREVAELIAQILHEEVEFTNLPSRPFDVQTNILQNTRIISEVDVTFASIEDGLRNSLPRHSLDAR